MPNTTYRYLIAPSKPQVCLKYIVDNIFNRERDKMNSIVDYQIQSIEKPHRYTILDE